MNKKDNIKIIFWFMVCQQIILGPPWSWYQETPRTYLILAGLCLIVGMTILSFKAIRSVFNQSDIMHIPRYARNIFILFMIWNVVTIARGIELELGPMFRFLTGNYLGWTWMVPLAMVLGLKKDNWRDLISISILHGIIGIILFIFVLMTLQTYTKMNLTLGLFYGCGFLLLTLYEQKKVGATIAICGVIFSLITSVLELSRNITITVLFLIFAAIGLNLSRKVKDQRLRPTTFIVLIITLSITFVSIYFISVGVESQYLPATINDQIYNFNKKISINSREGLYDEFLSQMTTKDMLIGRGANGTYYSFLLWDRNPIRENIEIGYFQMILKGGIVMVFLFLLVTVPAMWLGIFNSRNIFAKACGFVILGRLLDMVPFGLPSASPSDIILWMAVGLCWNADMRSANYFTSEIMDHAAESNSMPHGR